MKICVCGDCHGEKDLDKLRPEFMPYYSSGIHANEVNIMFIAGDAGFIWYGDERDNKVLNQIKNFPYIMLVIVGNHENYSAINKIPVEDWNGIKVRRVTDNCFYLVSPQIFMLNGKKYFIMNGATSLDKKWRTEGISWWREELPTEGDIEAARKLLEQHNNKVDYIITHCSPTKILYRLFSNPVKSGIDRLTEFYDYIDNVVTYDKWWMGHHHETCDMSDRNGHKYLIYNWIDEIN